MLTNENFKRSAELCAERDALLELSRQVNDAINFPPLSEKEVKKNYLKENDNHITGCLVVLIIGPLCGLAFNLGLSTTDNPIIAFFLSLFTFLLLFLGFRRIEKSLTLRKGKEFFKKQSDWRNEYYNEVLPTLQNNRQEINRQIQQLNNELLSFDGIPETEWEIATQLWYLFTTHQADSYKEALWLWNDMQHKIRIEAEATYQTQLAYEAMQYAEESKEYAYQAMISAEEAASNSRMSLVFDAYNTYKISQL